MSKEIDTKKCFDKLFGDDRFKNRYYHNIQRIIRDLKDELSNDDRITSESHNDHLDHQLYNRLLKDDPYYKWYKIGQQKLLTKLLDRVGNLEYGDCSWIDKPFSPEDLTKIENMEKEISILKETNKDLNKIIDDYEGRSK